MALVDTVTVEPNDLGIEPGDYSIHNLDSIGTEFLISSTGRISVTREGHSMWGSSEHTEDCRNGFLNFKDVEIVGDAPLEYLIDIENNQVINVNPLF